MVVIVKAPFAVRGDPDRPPRTRAGTVRPAQRRRWSPSRRRDAVRSEGVPFADRGSRTDVREGSRAAAGLLIAPLAGSICPLRRRAVERSQPDDQIALTLPAAAAVVVRACGTDIRVGGHQARHPAAGASPFIGGPSSSSPRSGASSRTTISRPRHRSVPGGMARRPAPRQLPGSITVLPAPNSRPTHAVARGPACARWPRPAPGQASGLARRHLRPRRVARRRVPALPANTESTCAAASAAGDLHRPASSTPHREAAALLPLDISLGR